MNHDTLHFDLGNGYHVRSITFQEYLDACVRLEDQIFGEYFGFNLSKALDDASRKKLDALKKNLPNGYQLCLGIFMNDGELVGWQYSVQEKGGEVLMKDTGILPAHQKKGTYKRLLPIVLDIFRAQGFTAAISYHRTTNNGVIVPKLKAGFLINGITTDEYGMAVQLIYPFNDLYRESLQVRSGERRPRGHLASLMGL